MSQCSKGFTVAINSCRVMQKGCSVLRAELGAGLVGCQRLQAGLSSGLGATMFLVWGAAVGCPGTGLGATLLAGL
jgi:hypothetical protein